MAQVILKNIWKEYRAGDAAVRDLNLEIQDKEFVCLLGPSGCGKSSTLRMIAGLEAITRGELYIDGKLVNNVSPRNRDIAMAFENYALYPDLTVYDNIAFPLWVRKTDKDETARKVNEVAELMGITDLLQEGVKGLSGGAQQRIGVARALVRNPKVLLLDEPISHLEEELKAKMREELRKLQRQLEVTTIYVTHDQIEAMTMADRIAIMDKAVLQQYADPETVFKRPTNIFVGGFIGEPPMNFIDCELVQEGGEYFIKNQNMRVILPKNRAAQMKKHVGKEMVLGIRNTHMKVEHSPFDEYSVKGEVYVAEPRNEDQIVTVKVGEDFLVVSSTISFKTDIGDTVWVSMNLDMASLFDRQTTVSVFE